MRLRRPIPRVRTIAVPALLAAVLLPAGAAHAKVRVSVLGWTTAPLATTPQVKNNGTIDQCLDTGSGQRSLYVIYRGRGIAKRAKVGVGVWGGPMQAGFTAEPTDADVIKAAFRWPVSEKRTSIQPYGFSFAKGPFGPQQITGVWQAKVIVAKKVVARGKVTIAC
jgi:hypothetical protein